ncbi:Ras-like protein family member 10B [Elysia marginata]|uniref:Ras-like protein family member 10B n=1 Tax=Elysia marginata TaxID=1093978 RepID=A0AAV4I6J1_9GAST|nr:Ras-like protein family member 10B [Elysia marginata]
MSRTLDEPVVTCQVWDTAGMERYRALLPHYMRHARCAVIVYDISNRESFDSVKNYWLDFVDCCGEEDLVKVLVGNKMDVPPGIRAVKAQEGEQLAISRGMVFLEASAKFGLNVDDIYVLAAKRAMAKPRPVRSDSVNSTSPVIKLDKRQQSKFACCNVVRSIFK